MSEKTHNPPAFPIPNDAWGEGMTLRDWFAGQALNSLLSTLTDRDLVPAPSDFARFSYGYADAMLAERAKEGRS